MIISDIKTKQSEYKDKNNEYFQVLKGSVTSIDGKVSIEGVEKGAEIHTHITPDGGKGYTIYQRRNINGFLETKAVGVGSGGKNFDWTKDLTL